MSMTIAREDQTLQLTADDLITIPPSPPVERTIQLSDEEVVVLEGVAASAEVLVRPADLLQPQKPAPLARVTSLLGSLVAVACRGSRSCWGGLSRASVWSWSASCRAAGAIRRGAGPALRTALRASRIAATRSREGLVRGGRIVWDASFPLRDWVQLKLRASGSVTTSDRAVRLRKTGPMDRPLVEDLQRALKAYEAGDQSCLTVAEVDGRVAIVVPGREAKVEVAQSRTEPTLQGRPALARE
jgi:hypothetical protein